MIAHCGLRDGISVPYILKQDSLFFFYKEPECHLTSMQFRKTKSRSMLQYFLLLTCFESLNIFAQNREAKS